jgi:heme exporter protein C
MLWKISLFIWMAVVIIAVFLLPPPQAQLGDVSRVFFFHVPMAWIAVLAFLLSLIFSLQYLRKKDLNYDAQARTAARLGLLFTVLATISGSIFAKTSWGSFWNWDPRETSIFILVFVIPRVYQSLHPNDTVINTRLKMQMSSSILITFLASLVGFTWLFVWIFRLETKINRLWDELEE